MRLVIAWDGGVPGTAGIETALAAVARMVGEGHQAIVAVIAEDADVALERALRAALPPEVPVATLLTQVRVDPLDPALDSPNRPIGPLHDAAAMHRLAAEHGWRFARDGAGWRRLMAALRPVEVLETGIIRLLAVAGAVVVCRCTGAPVAADDGRLVPVDALVDPHLTAALLASRLEADRFVMLGGHDGLLLEPGLAARRIARAAPGALAVHDHDLAAGPMAPLAEAAVLFAQASGRPALIGRLGDLEGVLAGHSGTWVANDVVGLQAATADQVPLAPA